MRLWGVVVAALACAARVAAAGPLDKPAFTATPDELLAEARALPKTDAEIVVLDDDVAMTFDAGGHEEMVWRRVYVVETAAGADDWSAISMNYAPSTDDVPAYRARVISASGAVTELDPSATTTGPHGRSSARRDANATLPALGVGSVVEEQIRTHRREPWLAGIASDWFALAGEVPVRRAHYTVTAPATAHVALVDAPGLPALRMAPHGALATWDVEIGPMAALRGREDGEPDELDRAPRQSGGQGPGDEHVDPDDREEDYGSARKEIRVLYVGCHELVNSVVVTCPDKPDRSVSSAK